jgi:hypothetical protein
MSFSITLRYAHAKVVLTLLDTLLQRIRMYVFLPFLTLLGVKAYVICLYLRYAHYFYTVQIEEIQ